MNIKQTNRLCIFNVQTCIMLRYVFIRSVHISTSSTVINEDSEFDLDQLLFNYSQPQKRDRNKTKKGSLTIHSHHYHR